MTATEFDHLNPKRTPVARPANEFEAENSSSPLSGLFNQPVRLASEIGAREPAGEVRSHGISGALSRGDGATRARLIAQLQLSVGNHGAQGVVQGLGPGRMRSASQPNAPAATAPWRPTIQRKIQWGTGSSFVEFQASASITDLSRLDNTSVADLLAGNAPSATVPIKFAETGGESTIDTKPGATGRVKLTAFTNWLRANKYIDTAALNESGDNRYSAAFDYTVDDKGNIHFSQPTPEQTGAGEGATVTVSPTSSDGMLKGFVQITAAVSTGDTVTHGLSAAPAGFGPSSSITYTSADLVVRTWKVNFNVVKDVKPYQMEPDPKFKVNSAEIADERALVSWFKGLPTEVQAAVRSGARKMTIDGFASTTAGDKHNSKLSYDRAMTAKKILEIYTGEGARIVISGRGRYDATAVGETESERRVEIRILPPDG
ncbi:OmpA family protein [Rhodococcus rhodochrous]|uniref:OmpA family protein n=1 Tax=Rhodococcus rhodochrous TaxID=1829 RepID=UPI000E738873